MKEAEEEEEEEARPVHAKPSVINPSRVDREKRGEGSQPERAARQEENISYTSSQMCTATTLTILLLVHAK